VLLCSILPKYFEPDCRTRQLLGTRVRCTAKMAQFTVVCALDADGRNLACSVGLSSASCWRTRVWAALAEISLQSVRSLCANIRSKRILEAFRRPISSVPADEPTASVQRRLRAERLRVQPSAFFFYCSSTDEVISHPWSITDCRRSWCCLPSTAAPLQSRRRRLLFRNICVFLWNGVSAVVLRATAYKRGGCICTVYRLLQQQ